MRRDAACRLQVPAGSLHAVSHFPALPFPVFRFPEKEPDGALGPAFLTTGHLFRFIVPFYQKLHVLFAFGLFDFMSVSRMHFPPCFPAPGRGEMNGSDEAGRIPRLRAAPYEAGSLSVHPRCAGDGARAQERLLRFVPRSRREGKRDPRGASPAAKGGTGPAKSRKENLTWANPIGEGPTPLKGLTQGVVEKTPEGGNCCDTIPEVHRPNRGVGLLAWSENRGCPLFPLPARGLKLTTGSGTVCSITREATNGQPPFRST